MSLAHILAFTLGILAVQMLEKLPPASCLLALALPAFLSWRWRAHYARLLLGVLLPCWNGRTLRAEARPAAGHPELWTRAGTARRPPRSAPATASD